MEEYKEKLRPRVSREERLRYRNEGCPTCKDGASLRRGSRFPFIVILAVCAAVYILFGRTAGSNPRTLEASKGRLIHASPVREGSRRGLSVVLENKSSQPWLVENLILSSGGQEITRPLAQTLAPGETAALFVPLDFSDKIASLRVEP